MAKETETIAGITAFLARMRLLRTLGCACLAIVAGATSASAFRPPDTNAASPTQHQLELRYANSQAPPYAMNYPDEVAQRLGVHDGQWEAFDTNSGGPLLPSFKGGVDSGSAMLKLQWQR